MKEKVTKKNQSVAKMFEIIEAMAGSKGPMRLQDISIEVNYPASTVLRMLSSLMENGYVTQNPETSKYSLSLKFCKIGEAVKSQFSIREVVRPFLEELSERCHESACLAIEHDMTVVYLDVVEGQDKMLRTLQRIGKNAPLHSTGIGKLLLLNYDSAALDNFIRVKGLQQLTCNTLTTKEALLDELDKVRNLGYAFDNEECELGAKCIAAPIRDYSGKVISGISVSGPISRMNSENSKNIIQNLLEISDSISDKLGYKKVE
ncbi:MAG: IclR family transcriptional regulator [Bacillota bacterium]|nr:IclR family transcriptional regulator [Bacillota bacterium]